MHKLSYWFNLIIGRPGNGLGGPDVKQGHLFFYPILIVRQLLTEIALTTYQAVMMSIILSVVARCHLCLWLSCIEMCGCGIQCWGSTVNVVSVGGFMDNFRYLAW